MLAEGFEGVVQAGFDCPEWHPRAIDAPALRDVGACLSCWCRKLVGGAHSTSIVGSHSVVVEGIDVWRKKI